MQPSQSLKTILCCYVWVVLFGSCSLSS